MHEIGRGVRAFEAAPVLGALVVVPGIGAVVLPEPAEATGGVVALVEDHATASLPEVRGELVAVVCTTGDDEAPLVTLVREAQVPCALGVSFDGDRPAEGAMVMVDCSDEEAVVSVVDGGTGSS